MKNRVTLAVAFTVLFHFTNAQLVNIPDPAFRQLINNLVPGAIVGTDLNTADPGVASLTIMDINDPAITDITGLQYFSGLNGVIASGHGVSNIPAFPMNLGVIDVSQNPVSSLPTLPPNLWSLHVDFCAGLSSLPALPSTLNVLSCSGNPFITLPSLPQWLGNLYVNDDQLTSLPALPPNLVYLSCSNNTPSDPHTFLSMLPNSLQILSAGGNGIYCLPNLPPGLTSSDIGFDVCQPQGTPDTWYSMTTLNAKRESAAAFAIGGKGYVSCGLDGGALKDLWEFNPVTNAWTQKANLPGVARWGAIAFGIGNKGYLGCGQASTAPIALHDFYEFDPSANTWTQKANHPGTVYFGMGSFVINSKGYVTGGNPSVNSSVNELYEYNPANNTWIQKASHVGWARRKIQCFAIGNKGYLCGGEYSNGVQSSCVAYDATTDTWTFITNMPTTNNEYTAFALNGKGYIVAGQVAPPSAGNITNYEYNPSTNSWVPKTDLIGYMRKRTCSFVINGRAYVTTGSVYNTSLAATTTSGEIFEYTPTSCTPPSASITPVGNLNFCTGPGIALQANSGTGLTYQWRKNSVDITGATNSSYLANSTGTFNVVVTNSSGCSKGATPVNVTSPPSITITPSGATHFCTGGSVTLTAASGQIVTYKWKKNGAYITGATNSSFVATSTGSYNCVVTNSFGCSKGGIPVAVTGPPSAVITANGPTTFCTGGSVVLTAQSGYTYQWIKSSTNISGATLQNYTATTAGNYKVKVTDAFGCSKITPNTNQITVNVPCKEGNIYNYLNPDKLIKVYPNPTFNEFTLNLTGNDQENISIAVYDITGKIVFSRKNHEVKNELKFGKEFPAGIYSVEVSFGEESKSQRIVKTR